MKRPKNKKKETHTNAGQQWPRSLIFFLFFTPGRRHGNGSSSESRYVKTRLSGPSISLSLSLSLPFAPTCSLCVCVCVIFNSFPVNVLFHQLASSIPPASSPAVRRGVPSFLLRVFFLLLLLFPPGFLFCFSLSLSLSLFFISPAACGFDQPTGGSVRSFIRKRCVMKCQIKNKYKKRTRKYKKNVFIPLFETFKPCKTSKTQSNPAKPSQTQSNPVKQGKTTWNPLKLDKT